MVDLGVVCCSKYRLLECLTIVAVVETHDHHAQVVGRIVRHGVIEESLACFLRVIDRSNNVDRILVVGYIPELKI